MVAVAADLPPHRKYRPGHAFVIHEKGEGMEEDVVVSEEEDVEGVSKADEMDVELAAEDRKKRQRERMRTLRGVCDYWREKGWTQYKDAEYVATLRRVEVALGRPMHYDINECPSTPEMEPWSDEEVGGGRAEEMLPRAEEDPAPLLRPPRLPPVAAFFPKSRPRNLLAPTSNKQFTLSYPSDQVWRCCAPIAFDDDETPGTTSSVLTINIRSCFRVQSKRSLFLSVDYSQLEVRLLAHFSRDPKLISILTDHVAAKQDVFRVIASTWLGKPADAISAEERGGAKRVIYGLIYGMGVGKLARDLNVHFSKAKKFVQDFNKEFPKVREWINAVKEFVADNG